MRASCAGWGVHVALNPWLSVGVHVDHREPFITLHLPGAIVTIGNIERHIWAEEAYRDNCERCVGTGSYMVACDCCDAPTP